MNEIEALAVLNNIGGVGPVKMRLLIEQYGSAAAALSASEEAIAALPGFGAKLAAKVAQWHSDDAWRKDLDLVERNGVNLITYADACYPKRLLDIVDYPLLLYVKGTLASYDDHSIAVVGTRNATVYGTEMAAKFGAELAGQGFTVVSGLARGVDTAAHNGALQRGRTIAVIGSGLARLYPADNVSLAERISDSGAVISEFPMLTPPDRQNFPQRNRIVSGISRGTLVIEAPVKSGAMITAKKALSQGRCLFALPGRIDNDNFRGNHQLIKENKARLVDTAEDIVACFGDLLSPLTAPLPSGDAPALEQEERDLLSVLPGEELPIDDIVKLAKLPVMKLNVLLMSLVLKRQIKEFPGKIYKKVCR